MLQEVITEAHNTLEPEIKRRNRKKGQYQTSDWRTFTPAFWDAIGVTRDALRGSCLVRFRQVAGSQAAAST
jgi:hypothetical protein